MLWGQYQLQRQQEFYYKLPFREKPSHSQERSRHTQKGNKSEEKGKWL